MRGSWAKRVEGGIEVGAAPVGRLGGLARAERAYLGLVVGVAGVQAPVRAVADRAGDDRLPGHPRAEGRALPLSH